MRARTLWNVRLGILRDFGAGVKLGLGSLGLGPVLEVFGWILRDLAEGSRLSEGFRGARRALELAMWSSDHAVGSCVR